jgi:hypothetical protein
MPHVECVESLRKRQRPLDRLTRHISSQQSIRAGKVRRQIHQRVDGLRRLRIPAGGRQRGRKADAKNHVERILLDRAVMFRNRLVRAPRQTKIEIGVHVANPGRDRLPRHRRLELSLSFGPVVVVGCGDDAEPCMSLWKPGIERDCTRECWTDSRSRRLRLGSSAARNNVEDLGERSMRQWETGVERNRLLVTLNALRESFARQALPDVMTRHHVRLVGGNFWRVARGWRGNREPATKLIDDRRRDIVLHGEDVGQLAIVTLGPQVKAVRHVDELCRDPNPVPGPSDAAFENGVDGEGFRDPADWQLLSFERER